MLKDKLLTECNKDKWIALQKKDAEKREKMRRAIRPQNKGQFH